MCPDWFRWFTFHVVVPICLGLLFSIVGYSSARRELIKERDVMGYLTGLLKASNCRLLEALYARKHELHREAEE